MQETKDAMSIDAMQKTKTTMDDATEDPSEARIGPSAPRLRPLLLVMVVHAPHC